jgi:hypothetical protein
MKIRNVILLLLLLSAAVAPAIQAQTTALSYQGRLTSSSSPANGTFDFRFRLATDSFGNNFAGGPFLTNGITVTGGLFTTEINFGAAPFNGQELWLQVEVRTNGVGGYTTLFPLQSIKSAPYAVLANTAGTVTGNVNGSQITGTIASAALPADGTFTGNVTAATLSGNGANVSNVNAIALSGLSADGFWKTAGNNVTPGQFLGSSNSQPVEIRVNNLRAARYDLSNFSTNANNPAAAGSVNVIGGSGNYVPPGVVGATISGGGATNWFGLGRTNVVTGDFGTIGGGQVNEAIGQFSTVGGGSYNYAIGDRSTVAGGSGFYWGNAAYGDSSVVGGGSDNWTSTNGIYGVVAGGVFNYVDGYTAVISGGWLNHARARGTVISGGTSNNCHDVYSTISGGATNVASGAFSVVSGGYRNRANALGAVVSGGSSNVCNDTYATIGGGTNNAASDSYATIAGGKDNIANGLYATIPGGILNVATNYSFAAGRRARATNDGAFVWGDSTNGDIGSTNNNSVTIRAAGGTRVFSNSGASAGVFLAPSGNAWNSISDREAKKDFGAIDKKEVLEKLVSMPVQRWHYKWESESDVPHIGPMAQDFKAAFYPGRDDKSISTMEFDGVALAAIQGLNQKVEENVVNYRKLEEKAARVDVLEQRVADLERMIQKLAENR